jgi:sialidase-1
MMAFAETACAPAVTQLFTSGQGGYHTYRIPALAVTPEGTLLAFCEGRRGSGSDHGVIDILLRRSDDGGSTWEPVRVVVADGVNTCGNPCPIVDGRTGTVLLLMCKNGPNETHARISQGLCPPRSVWVLRSCDDGRTWSAPCEISSQARRPGWRWYATGPGHGIQLRDGRLLAPCDHGTGRTMSEFHSHVIVSADGGDTWVVAGIQEGDTDESTVLERADGSLYLNMRTSRPSHRRVWSESCDGGETWSAGAEDAALTEPFCQASVLRLRSSSLPAQDWAVFSNPASLRRENLTLRLSHDGCRTWAHSRTLWPGPAAYSDLVECPDGTIGCLFECGEEDLHECIAFARIPVGWLTGVGADAPGIAHA